MKWTNSFGLIKNNKCIIVYYDVDYYIIVFVRVIIIEVRLGAILFCPLKDEYKIGIFEVGNIKLW